MLAKKKTERQHAIAATAAAERKKELVKMKRMRRESRGDDSEGEEEQVKDGGRHSASSLQKQPLDPMLLSAENPTAMLQVIGDHVNTRLKELEFDDDLDADLFDEQQRQLREAAALAACTRSRVLAPQVAAFLRAQQEQPQSVPANVNSPSTAAEVKMVRIGHNSNTVTAVCSLGCDVVVLGDKSGAVYMADLRCRHSSLSLPPTSSRKALLSPCLPATVLSIAVSDTRGVRPSQRALFERSTVDTSVTSYIAAGAADGTVSVWVTDTRKHMGFLTMHYAAVTGLAFRHDTLYSCSRDGTLRVWSVPQMICQDKLFGHQGHVLGIHCLKRERCATVGADGTMRFWKVDMATQQEFTTSLHFGVKVVLECVAMMNDSIVLCGASNGALLVFDVNRRKPLVVHEAAHGYGFVGDGTGLEKVAVVAQRHEEEQQKKKQQQLRTNSDSVQRRQNANPITALASMPYADVAASASYDGVVRLWRLIAVDAAQKSGLSTDDAKKPTTTFECFASIPIDAIVTSLYFPPSCNALFVGCGKEPRLGRWVVQRHALNAAYLVPLDDTALQVFASCAHVEHIPAALYGLTDNNDENDDDDEESENCGKKDVPRNVGSADSEDGYQNKDIDGDVCDDSGEETGLFTVGEDGQMEFSVPLEGGAASEKAPVNRKKSTSSKKNTTVTSRVTNVGENERGRLTKGAKKTKVSSKVQKQQSDEKQIKKLKKVRETKKA